MIIKIAYNNYCSLHLYTACTKRSRDIKLKCKITMDPIRLFSFVALSVEFSSQLILLAARASTFHFVSVSLKVIPGLALTLVAV